MAIKKDKPVVTKREINKNDDVSQLKEELDRVKSKLNQVSEKNREQDIVGPIFLIFLGVLFLLITTGVLSWAVFMDIWRFWPVLLILGGLRIIFGNSQVANILIGLLALATFGAILLLAVGQRNASFLEQFGVDTNRLPIAWFDDTRRSSQENQTIRVQRQENDGIESREVILDLAVGELELTDGALDDYAVVRSFFRSNFGRPEFTREENNGNLKLTLKQGGRGSIGFGGGTLRYEFELGQPEIPTAVKLNFGAGNGEINFSQVRLSRFQAEVGAGNLEMYLSEASIPQEEFKVNVGLGNAELTLPENVGYELTYSVGLGNINVNGQDLAKIGADKQTVRSENIETAQSKLIINVEVGLGNFTLKQQ